MEIVLNYDVDDYQYENYGDDYMDGSENNSVTFHNHFYSLTLKPSGKAYHTTITAKVNPQVGDKLYLVWVSYNTGDSNSTEYGKFTDIGVYDSLEKAQKTKELILLNDRRVSPDRQILDVDGLPVYTGTWMGYFNSLSDVRIEELVFEG